MKTRTLYLMDRSSLSVAAIEPSSAVPQGTLSAALEQALPSLTFAQELLSASRISLAIGKRAQPPQRRPGACAALAKSLDYYRMALAKETGTPLGQYGQRPGDDEGMREIRAQFGLPGRHCLTGLLVLTTQFPPSVNRCSFET